MLCILYMYLHFTNGKSDDYCLSHFSHLCCLVLLEGIDIEWILQNENRPTEYGNMVTF